MIALRLALALAAAVAALTVGAWAGGSPRGARSVAHPARVSPTSIADRLEVNGQPMELSMFTTPDAPARVVRFYAAAFEARGVVPIVSKEPSVAHVSGFDPKDGLQRFISAVPQPDGRTLVLVGATDPRRLPRFSGLTAGFPVPPGHRAFLAYRSQDGGARAESAQFVSSLAPAEVLAFYRAALPARGFRERPAESGGGLAVFAGASGPLSIAVQALANERGAAVFVTRTEGSPQ